MVFIIQLFVSRVFILCKKNSQKIWTNIYLPLLSILKFNVTLFVCVQSDQEDASEDVLEEEDPQVRCERNLLEHIQGVQDRTEEQLDAIEEQVACEWIATTICCDCKLLAAVFPWNV